MQMTKTITALSLTVLLLCTGIICCADTAKIDADAQALLQKVYEARTSAKTLAFTMQKVSDFNFKRVGDEKETENTSSITYDVAIDTPKKIHIKEDETNSVLVSNGTDLFFYFPDPEISIRQKMLQDIPSLMNYIYIASETALFFLPFQQATPMIDMFQKSTFAEFMESVSSIGADGEDMLDGKKMQKVTVTIDEVPNTIWIQNGEKPTIAKIVSDDTEKAKNWGESRNLEVSKYITTITFKNWNLDQPLPAQQFDLAIPDNVKKLTMFPPSHPLEGKPAPDFTTTQLDGKKFTLSELKGKKAVVLDFWATWCPPCRAAMPVLDKVMEEYKSEDVILFAVNQQEDKKTIEGYLTKENLHPTVGLDEAGAIGAQYQLQGIPQFVVINKEGQVVKVLGGVPPALDEILKILINSAI
jgi:thiol-disulfide isomerase/thioredoxin/outer membrane lipoprotein-sorting protein